MTKIAQQVKWLDNFRGTAALFKLTPAIIDVNYDDVVNTYEYVIVSAANVPFSGPETYIFPSNENGEVVDWVELDGSFRGSLDIWQALRNAGYEPVGLSIERH